MTSTRPRFLVQGLVAGAIGYALVVSFFAAANLVQGRNPLFTAAVLGNTLLGIPGTRISAAPVAVYNGLHLLVFLALGQAAAGLSSLVERRPELWYLLLSLGVFVFFHLFGVVAALAIPGGAASLPLVLAGGALAAAGMALWLWRVYPGVLERVRSGGDFEDPSTEPWSGPAS